MSYNALRTVPVLPAEAWRAGARAAGHEHGAVRLLLGVLLSVGAAVLGACVGLVAGMLAGHAVTGWLGVPDADGERAVVAALLFGFPLLVAGFDLGARLSQPRKRAALGLGLLRLGRRLPTATGSRTAHVCLRTAALLAAISLIGATTAPAQAPTRQIPAGMQQRAEIVTSDPVAPSGALHHDWDFEGEAGERVRILLRSGDFDAYLKLGRWIDGTYYEDTSDDDGYQGTDARIETVLRESGTYTIRAQSLFAGETGHYTLLFERVLPAEPARAPQAADKPVFRSIEQLDDVMGFLCRRGR